MSRSPAQKEMQGPNRKGLDADLLYIAVAIGRGLIILPGFFQG